MGRTEEFAGGRATSRPTAHIFDVDGTLADVSTIRHYVEGPKKDFNKFHEASVDVPPHPDVVALAHAAKKAGHAVIVVTARDAKWRNHTAMWLAQNNIPSDAMYMRTKGDTRPDYEVKKDIFDKISKHYDVVHAVDDNPNVIKLWKENNIPTTTIPGWTND